MIRTLLFSFLLSSHPVHVSLASVEYVSAKKVFEVFVKVWKNDFIYDYKITFPGELKSDSIAGFKPDRKQAGKYIGDKISIIVDDKNLSGSVETIDVSDEEIIIYLQYNYKGEAESIKVCNSLMTELYADQANMLIFKYKEIEEGVKFTPGFREQTFEIK